jgi:uncharacterized protein involved in cysteine biosynthesis
MLLSSVFYILLYLLYIIILYINYILIFANTEFLIKYQCRDYAAEMYNVKYNTVNTVNIFNTILNTVLNKL